MNAIGIPSPADWGYAVFMLAAIATGVAVSRLSRARLPLPSWQRAGLAVGAFVGAMLGAKLPFVLGDWEGLSSGAAWFDNGKTILTGMVGGYVGVEVAKWALEVRIKTGDSFAVPVAAAVMVGRLGCFHAGCCFGTPTALPWGVVFPGVDGVPRHPTQVYEAVFHGIAALVLAGLKHRGVWRGQLFKAYLLAYFAYRFGSELIRPEPDWFWGLTAYQWGILALTPVVYGLWVVDARRNSANFA